MFPSEAGARPGVEAMMEFLSTLDESGTDGVTDRTMRKAARLPTARLARMTKSSVPLPELMRARWGPDWEKPEAALAYVQGLQARRMIDARVSAVMADRLAPLGSLGSEEWLRRQATGNLCDAYMLDVFALKGLEDDRPVGRDLELDLLSLVDAESLQQFRALAEPSTSTLVVGLHAGAYALSKHLVETELTSKIRIGSKSSEGISNVKEDPIRAMMELIRHLRRKGSLATIRADGNFKGVTADVEVMDTRFEFGLGTPHAIFHSSCRNVFSNAEWKDDRIYLRMIEGPVKYEGERIEHFTGRWFEAWGEFIERLLRSDPRNMRGFGGLWPALGGLSPKKGPSNPTGRRVAAALVRKRSRSNDLQEN